MPIEKFDGRTIVIAGTGDIIWEVGQQEKDGEVDHIVISQGEPGEVDRALPEFEGKLMEDWAIKIVLPTKETWVSFNRILRTYALKKWGVIPQRVTRDDFMEAFREDYEFMSELSTDDRYEVFAGILPGESDITVDRLRSLLFDYGVSNIEIREIPEDEREYKEWIIRDDIDDNNSFEVRAKDIQEAMYIALSQLGKGIKLKQEVQDES